MSELPKGWVSTRLDEIVIKKKGKKPKQQRDTIVEGFVPYLDIFAIEKGVARQYAEISSSRLTDENDIYVVWDGARSGWIGKGQVGAIGSTIMALTPKEVDTDYLRFFLTSQFDTINSNTRGTGIPHVDPELFWNLDVPLAPLPEQHRIVAKLEQLLARVDACRAQIDKVPTILKRFRQSVLVAACSGRLTEDWREEVGEKEDASELLLKVSKLWFSNDALSGRELKVINEFVNNYPLNIDSYIEKELPMSWLCCNIGHIGIVSNGSTPSRKDLTYWGGSIPWVSSGEVRNNEITNTREQITEIGYQKTSVHILPKGTVLLAMIGEGKTRGQTAILKIDATINQNIAAIIPQFDIINSEYLWYWFQHRYELNREEGNGSGPQALNCQRVRELQVNLPPIEEQQEIVRRVTTLFAFSDQVEARYKQAKTHVDRLTQSILAKAFRGELVPQDPNDEPAKVLLGRIKAEKKVVTVGKKRK